VLGISKPTIYDWFTARGAPRNENGTIDLRRFIPWMIEYRVSQAVEDAESHAPSTSKSKADERWKQARAELKEIEVAERRKQFLRADDVNAHWIRCLTTLSQSLQSVPTGIAPRLIGKDIVGISAELERVLCAAVESVREMYLRGEIESGAEPIEESPGE